MVSFGKMAMVILGVWIVLAGAGKTTIPGSKKRAILRKATQEKAYGNKWASGFVQAPSAEDGLAFPAAPIL